jgi:hypothetical protein
MKLEKIKTRDIEKEITENDKENLFGSIIRGEEVTDILKTSKGDFKVKFPRARDLETIGRVLAYRLNGLSVQSIDPNTYYLMKQIATLDVLVLEGPAWYENAKKENKLTTWGDIPIQSFIQEVYNLLYSFREEVQKKIELGGKSTDSKMVVNENAKIPNSSGLFEGLQDS